jgi:hypothetical protein
VHKTIAQGATLADPQWKYLYDSALLASPRTYSRMSNAAKGAIRLRLLMISASSEPADHDERQALLLARSDLEVLAIAFQRYATIAEDAAF